MSEAKVKQEIIDKIDAIAKAMANGKDIIITTTANGIVIKKMTVQKV